MSTGALHLNISLALHNASPRVPLNRRVQYAMLNQPDLFHYDWDVGDFTSNMTPVGLPLHGENEAIMTSSYTYCYVFYVFIDVDQASTSEFPLMLSHASLLSVIETTVEISRPH